ncbi:MAG: hypothetical protein EPO32_09910 [Anaerolineae bacterium]|nr:MAG: hypothetical protein EPO32_09910 [Anaerolineae bacterium]
MLSTLLAVVCLGAATALQTTIAIQMPLLRGPVDLVLLTMIAWCLRPRLPGAYIWGAVAGLLVGFVSEQPGWLTLASYGSAALLAAALPRRVWDVPLLNLFAAVLVGSVLVHAATYGYIAILQTTVSLQDALNLVLLPSLVLNFLLALPIYGLMGEFAKLFYPVEVANE